MAAEYMVRKGCRDCGKFVMGEDAARITLMRAGNKYNAIPTQRNRDAAQRAKDEYDYARKLTKEHKAEHMEGVDNARGAALHGGA